MTFAIPFLLLTGALQTQTAPMVGETAPLLRVGTWLKGTPIPQFEKGKVYLIDIWATWCGPCIGGFPHLSELQDKYGKDGLVIIGLTGPDEYGTTLVKAKELLVEKGNIVRYRMAWDEGGRSYKQWMALESDRGWPFAFIVGRDGKVAYIGHPEGIDTVLPQILDGSFDAAGAAKAYANRLRAREVGAQMNALVQEKRYDEASKKFAELAELDKEASFEYAPFQVSILYNIPRREEAFKFAIEFAKGNVQEARGAVHQIATYLSDPKRAGDPDAANAAAHVARKYVDAFPAQPESYALMARTSAAKHDFKHAISQQQRAIELSTPDQKEAAQQLLDEYKQKADIN
jgi:thiol-disulfide isomerase/thioredoxin